MRAQNASAMSQEKIKKIHLIYGCILSVLLIAVGITLIMSCLDIYNSGDRPYSPASIGAHFQQIAILVYLTIVAVAGGIALKLLLPLVSKRPKGIIDEKVFLQRQQRKAGTLTGTFEEEAAKEVITRKALKIGTAVIFTALMIYPLIYFMDIDHFTVQNLNADIIKALSIALIPAAIGLILCFICKELSKKSILKETAIYKNAIAEGCYAASNEARPAKTTGNKIAFLRGAIVAIAIVFIIVGIFNGGADDVLLKAIAICTECIGLG